ncbi:MAG: sugar ABC transporter permease [Nitrososphaerota archaeon]
MRPETKTAILFILPSFIILALTVFYPIMHSLYITFHKWDLKSPASIGNFVGLNNYLYVLSSPEFRSAFINTLIIVGISLPISLFLALGIAMLLNQKFHGKKLLQAVLLIPWAIPSVAGGVIWKWIFNPNYGIANAILYTLGIIDKYQAFFSDAWLARLIVALAFVYKGVPFGALLLLAALQIVPSDVLESAKIDGAGTLQTFIQVTWYWIKPSFLVLLVLRTIEAFRVFDEIYVLTYGGPAGATTVLGWQIYLQAFSYLRFDFGSVIAYILAIITVSLSLIYMRVMGTREVLGK